MNGPLYEPPAQAPRSVGGAPTTLRMAEVVTINTDGTIDARPLKSRAGKTGVPCPAWYLPQLGERVLIADLDGDPQQPVCLGPMTPASGALTPPATRFAPPLIAPFNFAGNAHPVDLAATYANHPSGMQTAILPRTGRYRLVLQDFVRHTGPYTFENTNWGLAGSATRLDAGATFDAWMASAGFDGNRSDTHIAYYDADAGETVTYWPSYRLAAAGGAVGAHTFSFTAALEWIG